MSLIGRTYYEAMGEESKRQSMRDIYDIRRRQRDARFSMAQRLIGIGSSLWKTYSSNKELIDFARQEGYKPATDPFTNIFGTPSFTDPYGKTMSAMDMYGMQFYRDYEKTKNITEFYTGGE